MADMKRELNLSGVKVTTPERRKLADFAASAGTALNVRAFERVKPNPEDPPRVVGHINIYHGPIHIDGIIVPRPKDPRRHFVLEFERELGKNDILALDKAGCVLEGKKLLIPEESIKEATKILDSDSIIACLRK
ncbi:MAG: hypothetical protein J6T62_10310 [Fibrobacter sp.]|nr:hypothetical protein [Fibrobacter sp.]